MALLCASALFLPVSAETFTGALPQTEGTWELSLPVSAETFTGLDRELAGLLDSWAGLDRGRVYRLNAGISLLRAEAALSYAVLHSTDNLPEETAARWASYLKSCADCIITCRLCFGNVSSRLSKELLSASFERWQSCSEAFLMSVQSMR